MVVYYSHYLTVFCSNCESWHAFKQR